MKNKLKWFLKTLFGYSIAICTFKKDIVIKHRPFRSPQITFHKKKFHGYEFSGIIFDEALDVDEKAWEDLHELNKGE
jgi:hypothetical protein